MSEEGESSNSSRPVEEQGSDTNSFDLRAFHAAIKDGNVSLVKTLLKNTAHGSSSIDVEIWGKDDQGSTALHLAAEKGREEILDMLLDLHPDVNIQDGKGKTPLNVLSGLKGLSDQSAVHIVKRFLEEGADPRIPNQYQGRNCLHTAASVGNVQITRCLLDPQIYGTHTEKLVDINAVVESGQTALHLAAAGARFGGREDMLMELLRHKPNINAVDSLGRTAFYIYLRNKDNGLREHEVVQRFLQLGVDFHIVDSDWRTYLHVAVLHNKVDVIKCLLDPDDPDLPQRGPESLVDINAVDKDGLTALHLAALEGKNNILAIILDHNPDVNIRDRRGAGNTAFCFYLEKGFKDTHILRRFLQQGTNPNLRGSDCPPCLHLVSCYPDVLRCLLDRSNFKNPEYHLDPNESDAEGFTPLHHAVCSSLSSTPELQLAVRELLKHEADPNFRTKFGWDNLYPITGPRRSEIINILSHERGKYFKVVDNGRGLTTLHIAAANGYNDAVEALLEHGANAAARDNLGMTPLMLYIKNDSATSRILDKFQKCGGNLNVLNAKKQNLLHVAAKWGSRGAVRALLDSKVNVSNRLDINAVDEDGSTALHLAAIRKHDDVLEELLAHHPDVNIRDKQGNTALILYCGKDSASLSMVENFIRRGAKLQILNEDRQGCLHAAAAARWIKYKDQARFVRGLTDLLVSGAMEMDVAVNAPDVRGSTPRLLPADQIRLAVNIGSILRLVVNAADVHGSTPRLLAAAYGYDDVLPKVSDLDWHNPLSYLKAAKQMVWDDTSIPERRRLREKYLRFLHVDSSAKSPYFPDRKKEKDFDQDPWLVLPSSKEGNEVWDVRKIFGQDPWLVLPKSKESEEPRVSSHPDVDAPGKPFSSKMALRSDALALGFKEFRDTFDSARILVVVVESPDDAVEISFFHPEGMALLLGVGVPFSKVVLNTRSTGGSIQVQEIGEAAWRVLWRASPVVGSLAVCNARAGMQDHSQEAEGSNVGEIHSVFSLKNQHLPAFGNPQHFLFPLPAPRLRSRMGLMAAEASTTPMASLFSLRTLLSRMGLIAAGGSSTGPANNDASGGSGIGGANRAGIEEKVDPSKGKDVEKLELTVKVFLNSKKCNLDLTKCQDEPQEQIRDQLKKQIIEPVLTISFFKNDEGDKIFKTHLDVTFGMKADVAELDDDTRFGWFHNHLRMGFKCLAENGVAVDGSKTYLLDCEDRQSDEVHGHNQSTQRTEGREKSVAVSLGYKATNVGGDFRLTNGTGSSCEDTRLENSKSSRVFVKNTNFLVEPEGSKIREIAYLASLSDQLDVLSPAHRKSVKSSGRISRVSIQAEGHWKIIDDEERIENRAQSWCSYEFTGSRNFKKVVLKKKVQKRTLKSNVTTVNPEGLDVEQTIVTQFLIDHNFFFVERLRRKKPYEWELVTSPVAPPTVSPIMKTAAESTNPSSSRPASHRRRNSF